MWVSLTLSLADVLARLVFIGHLDGQRLYFAPEFRADNLLLGCTLALFVRRIDLARFQKVGNLLTFIGLALLLFIATRSVTGVGYAAAFGFVAAGWSAALMIAGVLVAPNSIMARLFSIRPLTYVGRVSYSFYHWNAVISPVLTPRLIRLDEWTHPILVIATTFVVAAFSYHVIERPFLKLKKRFEP